MYKLFFILCSILLLSFNIAIAQTTTADNNTFNRIALCESGGDMHAKSPYSSASGEFQFIWSSWNHYGKELWGYEFYEKNIWSNDNRELAWYVFTKYGTKDWSESKSCWSKQT